MNLKKKKKHIDSVEAYAANSQLESVCSCQCTCVCTAGLNHYAVSTERYHNTFTPRRG